MRATPRNQAMVVAVIFVGLLVFYLRGQKKGGLKDGDTTLLFLICYGASQVILDSTRYDSLFFRSNGFVSIVQVLGACAIGFPTIWLSIRLVKQRGFKLWYIGLWLAWAALMGLGGYMEYYVQRHGDRAVFAYSLMGAALVALVALGIAIWYLAEKAPKKEILSEIAAEEKQEEEAHPEAEEPVVPEEQEANTEFSQEFDLNDLDLENL